MGRAPCCDKANVKRGSWSPEEDAKLKDFIQKFGIGGNWLALPHKAGLKRCGKSCRLRWLNYLRPNIKHGEFSDEEDRVICALYSTIGSRWSIIAAQLPGRTDNDIKNYWNTKLKKKLTGFNNTPFAPTPSSSLFFTPQLLSQTTNPKSLIIPIHPQDNTLQFHHNYQQQLCPVKENMLMFGRSDHRQASCSSSDRSGLISSSNGWEENNNIIINGGDQVVMDNHPIPTNISCVDLERVSQRIGGGNGGMVMEDCSNNFLFSEDQLMMYYYL